MAAALNQGRGSQVMLSAPCAAVHASTPSGRPEDAAAEERRKDSARVPQGGGATLGVVWRARRPSMATASRLSGAAPDRRSLILASAACREERGWNASEGARKP